MVFITAGMGGGTGTGAAPTIAKAAREIGILTVGVVTKPFHFEGRNRSKLADSGIDELQQYVDTLIVIPNQNLFRVATENTTFADAFRLADDVLYSGVRGVTDLMMMPGLINLDFADIRTVMAEMGKAMMGTGEAEGPRRALDAAEVALSNPLLDDVSMKGAKGVLINITGGYDMTLYEVDEAANRIRDEVDSEANIIFGSTFDERLNGMIRVSVVATGIGPTNGVTTVSNPAPTMAKVAPEEAPEVTSFAGMRSPFATTQTADAPAPVEVPNELSAAEEPAVPFNTEAEETLAPDFHSHAQPPLTPQPLEMTTPQPETQERRRPISLFERFSGRTKAPVAAPEPPAPQKTTEEISEIDFMEIPAFLRKGTGTNI
jgi:cell division protein FtsZ